VVDLNSPRPARRNTVAGLAGLFGLLAGLIAIFVLVVTAMNWRDEAAGAEWPLVTAVIDRGDVTASPRVQGNTAATAWRLRYIVRYEVDGEERSVTLGSGSAYSNAEAAKLHAWAAQHRHGGYLDVRYDPAQPGRAVFASDDVPNAGARSGTDVVLGLIFAIACVGLLALAKHLRLRGSQVTAASTTDHLSHRARIAIGIACAAPGIAVIVAALLAALHGTAAPAGENLIAVPAGLIFVFGGAFLASPPDNARWQSLSAALLITCFALTFDWVAFGPGERRFGGGASFGPMADWFQPGEFFGRAVFGLIAVALDGLAVKLWIDRYRQQSKPAPNSSIEQDAP
jgi:Protein of unknown function (DUF3592)